MNYELLQTLVREHPYPLLFATVSGAHLYGFPSPDSDYDLRGTHILPLQEVIGLDNGEATIEQEGIRDGVEMDIVSHDVEKFFRLMLRRNGYVLEQLYSPLVVHTTPEHDELKVLGATCITRWHAHHYLGFAETQWKLFSKAQPRRGKPLLYVFRVLLTGIHLMRTGEIEANLLTLNESFQLPYVADLVMRKIEGQEKSKLADGDWDFYEQEFHRLMSELETARDTSMLPDEPSARPALHDLLVRVRLAARNM